MLDSAITMTADQALELHDAYWYIDAIASGKRRGAWIKGEKAKIKSLAEGLRLAVASFIAAGGKVDSARYACSTDVDCDAAATDLVMAVCGLGAAHGIDPLTGGPAWRRCQICGRPHDTWNDRCASCPE